MEFIYTSDKRDEIIRQEKIMFEKYSYALEGYRKIIEGHNYSLMIGMGRSNVHEKKLLEKQKNLKEAKIFKNGYQCYAWCLVEKDDEAVEIESEECQGFYEILGAEWQISEIKRDFLKLKARLFLETAEEIKEKIKEDMDRLIERLMTGNLYKPTDKEF